MRAKTILTVLFGISFLFVAFAGVQMMAQKSSATAPKEQILAATMPLPVGTLLRAQDVTWQSASEPEPDAILRPNATAVAEKPEIVEETMASVYGAVLRHPLAAGTPIRRSDFVKPGDRDFLQVVLTPGSRAIAIPVATGGASTGLLSPGDRVDVILTQNFKNDSTPDMRNTPVTRRSVSETVVESLRVLAIDAPDPKQVNANPANGNFGRTVTLEVTADQAELINVSTELGKLSLTLRSVTGPTSAADSTRFAAVTPPAVATPPEHVKPKWAGDASPALYGAAQEKPVALKPPPIQVFHGSSKAETITTEN
jgi:pilus assembly protein CpaB